MEMRMDDFEWYWVLASMIVCQLTGAVCLAGIVVHGPSASIAVWALCAYIAFTASGILLTFLVSAGGEEDDQ